jgi:DNA-binding NarL/FixJ family response regulator
LITINTIRQTPPTPREREVILLIRRGLQNKQIAYALNIAEGTVKVHIKNISRKYGLHNRTQIALMSHEKSSGLKSGTR